MNKIPGIMNDHDCAWRITDPAGNIAEFTGYNQEITVT